MEPTISDVKGIGRRRYDDKIDRKGVIFGCIAFGWVIVGLLATFVFNGCTESEGRIYELDTGETLVVSYDSAILDGYVLERTNLPPERTVGDRATAVGIIFLVGGPFIAWFVWLFYHVYRRDNYYAPDFAQRWLNDGCELPND